MNKFYQMRSFIHNRRSFYEAREIRTTDTSVYTGQWETVAKATTAKLKGFWLKRRRQ